MQLTDGVNAERRRKNRRYHRRYRFAERRTGFDRRSNRQTAQQTFDLDRALLFIRNRPPLYRKLLLLTNALNLADFALTLLALESGNSEINPIMAELFLQSSMGAGTFKTGLVGLATALLWSLRSFRTAILALLIILASYLWLLGYHITGLLLF